MNIPVKPVCSRGAIHWHGDQAHYAAVMGHYKKTYLRQWRKHRGRTLEQVAEHLHMTHGQLSKIERGVQPYNQALIEALAELYMCEPADLLIRDPDDPQGIWSVWDHAAPGEREKIVQVARTILGMAA